MTDQSSLIETLETQWMRAWAGQDGKALKALTHRKFRMVIGSKPSVILDVHSWLAASNDRFACSGFRFGDVYARQVGKLAVFAARVELKVRLDDYDWSGEFWVTDVWRKSGVRRRWQMMERMISRVETDEKVAPVLRSLQLWKRAA